jgi:hypothetical protein
MVNFQTTSSLDGFIATEDDSLEAAAQIQNQQPKQ